MTEWADVTDLKSVENYSRKGSNPFTPTNKSKKMNITPSLRKGKYPVITLGIFFLKENKIRILYKFNLH